VKSALQQQQQDRTFSRIRQVHKFGIRSSPYSSPDLSPVTPGSKESLFFQRLLLEKAPAKGSLPVGRNTLHLAGKVNEKAKVNKLKLQAKRKGKKPMCERFPFAEERKTLHLAKAINAAARKINRSAQYSEEKQCFVVSSAALSTSGSFQPGRALRAVAEVLIGQEAEPVSVTVGLDTMSDVTLASRSLLINIRPTHTNVRGVGAASKFEAEGIKEAC
jgi:hypothetical protein